MEWPFTTREVLALIGYHFASNSDRVDMPCPYCNDTKKHLNFHLTRNQFRCNRCGAHGNTLQFYQYMLGLSTCKEAYWDIMERMNLKDEKPIEIKKRRERVKIESKKVTTTPLLDIVPRHVTYQAILDHLSLDETHAADLEKRGLSRMEIENLGYKSFPGSLDGIMDKLRDDGVKMLGVPGFYEYYGKVQFIKNKKGILVPYRNINGYIEGVQLRIDDSERVVEKDGKLSTKYLWISSSMLRKGSGSSAVHYACEFSWNKEIEEFLPVIGKDKTIYLTEGAMKADVAHYLCDYRFPFIAVPGVNHIDKLAVELQKLRDIGVEKVVLMYDMDYQTNPHVQTALQKTKEIIKKLDFQYIQSKWNKNYKGIDDYLNYRKQKSVQ